MLAGKPAEFFFVAGPEQAVSSGGRGPGRQRGCRFNRRRTQISSLYYLGGEATPRQRDELHPLAPNLRRSRNAACDHLRSYQRPASACDGLALETRFENSPES